MPIMKPTGALCAMPLPEDLAGELEISTALTCALAEEHGPAPDCAALLETAGFVGQVVWRLESMIPLRVITDEYCHQPLPDELADAFGIPRGRRRCGFDRGHRGACTEIFKRAALAWWPRPAPPPLRSEEL